MDDKSKILIGSLVIGLVVGFIFFNSGDEKVGGVRGANYIVGGCSHASTTVSSSTVTVIFSKDANRKYASICNTDGSNDVYLYFAPTSASTTLDSSEGYTLQQAECYEIEPENLYINQVYGLGADDVVVSTLDCD